MQSSDESSLLSLLYCNNCGEHYIPEGKEVVRLICPSCRSVVPVENGIPRFLNTHNYSDSFGFQWNKYNLLQLDSYNKTSFSKSRLYSVTGWTEKELEGKLILDAGCGAGRFTEILLNAGAKVISVDMSTAVEACYSNTIGKDRLVCQASILNLPLKPNSFDYLLCIGVIQHTPSPLYTISQLSKFVKPGGKMGLWIYELNWKSFVGTIGFKYFLRPVTKKIDHPLLLKIIKKTVNFLWPLIKWARYRGQIGKIILRLLPVASAHLFDIELSDDDFKYWVELDTFDMYSPEYDKPQRFNKIKKHLSSLNFENIERGAHGGVSISGIKGIKECAA